MSVGARTGSGVCFVAPPLTSPVPPALSLGPLNSGCIFSSCDGFNGSLSLPLPCKLLNNFDFCSERGPPKSLSSLERLFLSVLPLTLISGNFSKTPGEKTAGHDSVILSLVAAWEFCVRGNLLVLEGGHGSATFLWLPQK